jgi:F-type H+-transporting ATPase subunit epsilon
VIAQTIEGQMGILTGHVPVLGVLVDGSVVRIKPVDRTEWVTAMVGSGFFSVAEDQVAVLAEQAELSDMIDIPAARVALQEALDAEVKDADAIVAERRARARLRAAGEEV